VPKYTPMIEQYLEIKNKYKDCILFFQLGDFYEMFFDHAHIASRILGIALTGRDAGQADRIPMCGIPVHAIDNYLPKLVEKGYKVAICEQVQNPSEAKVIVKREVTRIITPGITLEDKIIENNKNNYILCIFKYNEQVALAAADITTGDFFISSLDNQSPKTIINEILSYSPKEVLLTFSDNDWEKRLANSNLYITNINNHIFDIQIDPLEIFNNHFSENGYIYPDNLNITEKNAVGWLLVYINNTQKRQIYHLNKLSKKNISDKMLLDYNARRNLELTETLRAKDKSGSLLWVIDKTVTAIGARTLRSWLENPLINIEKINERLDAVDELSKQLFITDEINNILKNTYDIERLISKLSYGTANARDLVSLKNTLLLIPRFKELLLNFKSDIMIEANNKMSDVSTLTAYLDKALLDNPPISIKEGGMIKDGFNNKLDEYRNITIDGKKWIVELEKQERERTKIKSLKVGYNKVFGYYIEITKSNLSQVPPEYERKQTLANAERYITDELKYQEELILKADDSLVDLELQLFIELREYTLSFISDLQNIAKSIATIDVLQSLANVSITNRYIRPIFNTKGEILITQGRHPVVEKVIMTEDYVPNNVLLNNTECQIQLITGPNMAGKSTYMRQTALILLLAQIGSFVPVESANLCIVDRIFTRIGASDDLSSGQSTFMVEMVETKEALLEATENSLILLDEVGRGTSTYDGMALAQSIIEYIHQHVKAKTLFSTHYHELTQLETIIPRVVNYNARCIESDQKVIFLHQIEQGKADKSYGIYVAHIAGMPLEVTNRAKELLQSFEKDVFQIEQSQQLTFFSQIVNENNLEKQDEHIVLKELRQAEIMQMSPLDALNYLYKLQKMLEK
jgi:DNA mismatch repair protein MutS